MAHEGEGPTIEYKSVLPTEKSHKEHFARTVVAFANTGGGTIIFGIAPDGPEETKLVGWSLLMNRSTTWSGSFATASPPIQRFR